MQVPRLCGFLLFSFPSSVFVPFLRSFLVFAFSELFSTFCSFRFAEIIEFLG